MKIFLAPVRYDDRFYYEFEEDMVKATFKGVTDTFDFTSFWEGELEMVDPITEEPLIETDLEVNPISKAERKNGVLYVELINFIGVDATEKERFPDWIDHTEYISPKAGEASGTDEMEE